MLEQLKINDKSRVLFIYPHPDDETYSNACLINRLVKANISLKVVCLTKGAKSTLKFGLDGRSLADVREQEFKNVMNYLNVTDYEIWNLEDGELETTQNLEQLVRDLINTYKPTHVGTFEPCGIYGHPDHIHLSKVITNLKNQYNFTLIYATVGNNFKPSADTLSMAKNPSKIKPLKSTAELNLSTKEYIQKIKALQIYKSQVNIKHHFMRKLMHLWYLRKEYYAVVNV